MLKKKTVEKYVDSGLFIDAGPNFCLVRPQRYSHVFAYGIMLATDDPIITVQGIYFEDKIYRLSPEQNIGVTMMMPNMGYLWGTIINLGSENPVQFKFGGFMEYGTPEEFVRMVYSKYDSQLDVL